MIWETLDEALIVTDLEALSSDEIFEQLGRRLIKQGYCKPSYVEALKIRERDYPTGINTQGINFAMPHTDQEHVNAPAVAIGVLKQPVHFYHMGTTDVDVLVHLIFMLAVKDSDAHLAALSRLLQLFQDQKMLMSLTGAKNSEEIINIFKEREEALETSGT